MIRTLGRLAGRVVTVLLVAAIRVYQWTISPFLGPACRFEPTCSQYMIEAMRKYGPIRGMTRGLIRLTRCHPWHPGGHDPP